MQYPEPKDNACKNWTDNDLLRRMTLSTADRSERRVLSESVRVQYEIGELHTFMRDVARNYDIKEERSTEVFELLKKAAALVQAAEDLMVEELAQQQGR